MRGTTHTAIGEHRSPVAVLTCTEVITMPQEAWSEKRERQYEHIKESELERGRSEERAKEIAAATVNKTRARKGETQEES